MRDTITVMATIGVRPAGRPATHEVVNQPPPLEDRNLFTDHVALVEALEREGGGWAREQAEGVGAAWGGEPLEWGRLANEHPPRLRTHDRFGHRIDEVEFHPPGTSSWRWPPSRAARLPWTSERAGAHVARAAMGLTTGQVEAGHGCPMTMTFAAVPALRAQPELAAEWEPLLTAAGLRRRAAPAAEKGSAKCGMAMTEKQGGSDVRQHDDRHAGGRRRRRRGSTCCAGTSGSARRRCATCSSSWPRPTRASAASPSRGSCPTARATPSACSA